MNQLQMVFPNYDERQGWSGVTPPSLDRLWNPPRDRVPVVTAPAAAHSQAHALAQSGAVAPEISLDTITSLGKTNASLHQQALELEKQSREETAAISLHQSRAAAAALAAQQRPSPSPELFQVQSGEKSHQQGEPDLLFWIGLVMALLVAEYFLSRRVNY